MLGRSQCPTRVPPHLPSSDGLLCDFSPLPGCIARCSCSPLPTLPRSPICPPNQCPTSPEQAGPICLPYPLIFGEGPLTLTSPIRSSLPTSPPALSVGQRTPSCQSDSPLYCPHTPSASLALCEKGGTLFSLSLSRLVCARSPRSPGLCPVFSFAWCVHSVEAGVCPQ
jgi:hypothetical protein